MCTAATYKTADFYFGRTLDYEHSFGEEVTIAPRNYSFGFKYANGKSERYAIIGMAHVATRDGEKPYPLFYDAMNECGLCAAGLNFVDSAVYCDSAESKTDVAQYEFIPFILQSCKNVKEARKLLKNANITNARFGNFETAKLHWLIADREDCITVEQADSGLKVYDNRVGVLTNEPPFDKQMFALNNYMALSAGPPKNNFGGGIKLKAYSRGMGAMGLPGDLSSQSRFVRAAFVRANSKSASDEPSSVGQFFHILGAVEQQRGCCELENGKHELTIYTSCCNATRGVYYYTCYTNRQINAVDMHRADLDASELCRYPLLDAENINYVDR